MVMLDTSSPRDLYSTIRSFKPCYQLFVAHKSLILSTVIQLAIPAEILPDALAACHVSTFRTLERQRAKMDDRTRTGRRATDALDQRLLQHIVDFFIEYQNQRQQPPREPVLLEQSISIPLYRLWATADFFISMHSTEALGDMRRYLAKQNIICSNLGQYPCYERALSETEQGRWQRAYFRFEIYRKLFRPGPRPRDPTLDRRQQMKPFIGLLKFWEREELACVHEFLIRMMENSYDRLEDEFVEEIKDAAEEVEGNPEREQLKSESGRPKYTTDTRMLDWFGFMYVMYRGSQYSEVVMSMVRGGLPFLRRLWGLEKKNHMHIIIMCSSQLYNPPLEKVLEFTVDPPREQADFQPIDLTAYEDSLQECNLGWLWADKSDSSYEYSRYPSFRPQDYGLRTLGYVFWDKERLLEAGLLEQLPNELEPFPAPQDKSKLPSVAERLRGVPLSIPIMEKYGSGSRKMLEDFEY